MASSPRPTSAAKPAPAARYTPPTDVGFIFYALSRCGYGPRVDDVGETVRTGFARWVDQQLHPDDSADTELNERFASATLPIKYAAGNNMPDGGGVVQAWPARDEQRPLTLVNKPIEELWPLLDHATPMDYAERRRPRDEVIAATILRAVHSRWQLREVLVDFWHKHFNVDAFSSDQIMVALPIYDHDVIRRHAFGNFRAFLEAVATSAAMQYYLSNRSSRAGAANENYARELFELHTLGRGAYLNDRYNRWREVPGALKGAPAGYIDQDVYEAARAFTGWTIEDGTRLDGRTALPKTGRFVYVDGWHDGYQKRVLATEFDPFQSAMADGRKVLDLVAAHPATAHFVCTKLCTRLVADVPPPSIVAKAETTWRLHQNAPDQIAQVVRVIVLSPEFAAARGVKVRHPLAVAAAFARATGIDLTPTEGLANQLASAGERLFGWPSPDGLPEAASYYVTTNGLRRRWELVIGLADNAWKNGAMPPPHGYGNLGPTPRALVTIWVAALNGVADEKTIDAILQSIGSPPDQPMGSTERADVVRKAARIAAYAALTPSFQST